MTVIRNLSAVDIALNDLSGITVEASSDYNLNEESHNDIANSQDLNAAIAAGDVVFLDNAGIPLSQQESLNTQDNISATQPAIIIQENGVNLVGTPHNVLNFSGTGISVTDAGAGVATIDAFKGLSTTIIGGEQILTTVDSTRANKILSVEKINLLLVEDSVSDGTYLDISYLTNTNGGYIIPLNATIVGLTLHKISGSSSTTMQYDLYVDGVLHTSNIVSSSGSSEEKKQDNALDIDLTANEKITIRGKRTAGSSTQTDVSIMLYIRWRG